MFESQHSIPRCLPTGRQITAAQRRSCLSTPLLRRAAIGLLIIAGATAAIGTPAFADGGGGGHGGGGGSGHGPPTKGGTWQFSLSLAGSKSNWEAHFKKQTPPKLQGNAEPDELDCTAGIKGKLTGKTITMTWTVKSGCAAEVITFKGTYKANKMSGTIHDSRFGNGTFTAQSD